MKHDSNYRFSLQFKNDTTDNIMVGDFLCKIGYKKSRFIIEVIAEYLKTHPELLQDSTPCEIQINAPPAGRLYQELRDEMKAYIDEKLSNISAPNSDGEAIKEEIDEDLSDMLLGIDAFSDI